jgi:sigma-B regulation protein RsbU (phosphoserine phosphatase)
MTSTKSLQFAQLTKLTVEIVQRFSDLRSAGPELTRFLCQWFDCEWGTYWHVDENKDRLIAIFTWNKDSMPAQKLKSDTQSKSLGMSEGTPGQVWRSGRPVCTNDVVLGLCLPRSLDANAIGLRGGIWFPIRMKKRTFAVIEMLGQHYWSCDQRFVDELALLGFALGNAYGKPEDERAARR